MDKLLHICALLSLLTMSAKSQEQLTWIERARLSQPRAGYIAGVIDGRYIVAGGSYWQGNQKIWTSLVDIYDPRKNAWREAAPLPQPRSDAACAVVSSSLYLFGGQDHTGARSDALVLQHGRWRQLPEAALPEPRLYASAAVSADSIYILGGMSKVRDPKSISNSVWRWDLTAPKRRWEMMPPIPGPGLINTAVAVVHEKIYVFGGATAGGKDYVNSDRVYEFDVPTQRWTLLPNLPIARRCWSAVPIADGVLLIGGYTEVYENEVFEYDPASHSLNLVSVLPNGICDAKFFRIGQYVIGAGGESGDRLRGPWTFESKLPSRKVEHIQQ